MELVRLCGIYMCVVTWGVFDGVAWECSKRWYVRERTFADRIQVRMNMSYSHR